MLLLWYPCVIIPILCAWDIATLNVMRINFYWLGLRKIKRHMICSPTL